MSSSKYLKKGDKVAILCPASYINVDLTNAYSVLTEWGLTPVVYPSVTAQENQFAGPDALRASDLQEALDNPDIKAIIAGRGGYGTVRIIDQLDFTNYQKHPKWIVGFSDITVLHSHILTNYAIPTIHGQMVKTFLEASEASLTTLRNALFGDNIDISYSAKGLPHREGEGTGILTGGNLAILQSILGSTSDVNYDDKILFIEDVGESLYNIDRMLWSLKRAKKLHKLKGLIIGGFTELKDADPSFGQGFMEIIADKVKEYDFPIAYGFPAGHINDNRALVFGRKITLSILDNNVNIYYQH